MNAIGIFYSLMSLIVSAFIILIFIFIVDHANLYEEIARHAWWISIILILATLLIIPVLSFSTEGILLSQTIINTFAQKLATSILIILAIYALARFLGMGQKTSNVSLSYKEAKTESTYYQALSFDESERFLTLTKEELLFILHLYNENNFIAQANNDQFANISQLLLLAADGKPISIENLSYVLETMLSMGICPPESVFELFMILDKYNSVIQRSVLYLQRERVITFISKNFSRIDKSSVDNLITQLGNHNIELHEKETPPLDLAKTLSEAAYEEAKNDVFFFLDQQSGKRFDIDAGEYILSRANNHTTSLHDNQPKKSDQPALSNSVNESVGSYETKPRQLKFHMDNLYDPLARIDTSLLFQSA